MIFTVGHGARRAGELVAILKEADVRTLIDVRAFPVSRRHLGVPRGDRVVHRLAPGRTREHTLNPQEELWRED